MTALETTNPSKKQYLAEHHAFTRRVNTIFAGRPAYCESAGQAFPATRPFNQRRNAHRFPMVFRPPTRERRKPSRRKPSPGFRKKADRPNRQAVITARKHIKSISFAVGVLFVNFVVSSAAVFRPVASLKGLIRHYYYHECKQTHRRSSSKPIQRRRAFRALSPAQDFSSGSREGDFGTHRYPQPSPERLCLP
ncbi:MAG: hypothetical protein LBQ62_09210 [Candidatus Accumulibacter sp.]|nr:hypothetical protein [Accumulibacter sp.]